MLNFPHNTEYHNVLVGIITQPSRPLHAIRRDEIRKLLVLRLYHFYQDNSRQLQLGLLLLMREWPHDPHLVQMLQYTVDKRARRCRSREAQGKVRRDRG